MVFFILPKCWIIQQFKFSRAVQNHWYLILLNGTSFVENLITFVHKRKIAVKRQHFFFLKNPTERPSPEVREHSKAPAENKSFCYTIRKRSSFSNLSHSRGLFCSTIRTALFLWRGFFLHCPELQSSLVHWIPLIWCDKLVLIFAPSLN